jgi:thiosulfate/3-mercaptopyruvate sulfurtransferase
LENIMTNFDSSNLVSPAELAADYDSDTFLVVLDVRFDPGKPGARDRYSEGHLPGAVYVDLPTELADANLKDHGSYPLPDPRALGEHARRWGISADSKVVVYDDTSGAGAARAWWVLKWAGLRNVRILDGGLAAWKRDSRPLAFDEQADVPAGAFVPSEGSLPSLFAGEVLPFSDSGILVDVRPANSFSGDGTKTGHIPGALNLPIRQLVDDSGSLLSPERLRALLAEHRIDLAQPIAAYCGGGVASAFFVLALTTLNTQAAIYPGSWSEWIRNPQRPIAA